MHTQPRVSRITMSSKAAIVDLLNLDAAPGREQADACLSHRHVTMLCSILKINLV